jgi:GNAT superfamily N-acetyltransferase
MRSADQRAPRRPATLRRQAPRNARLVPSPKVKDVTNSNLDTFLTTRTGSRFHVRPVRTDDDGTIKEFFSHVSRADLRFRFLSGINEVSPSQMSMLTHPDHQFSESFLVFTADGSMMVASGMLACDKTFDHGEVAIAVREDHKNQGIGWELLAHIARYADTKGLRSLESIESRDNHDAIELERDMGFVVSEYPGDSTLVLVSRSHVRP